ncbi:MAG TPA: hypothetical protein VMV04_08725 [Thermodesulfobacteriota bacterium]|nr:hypothetical protein [Thermodesulfobacteriota bacterium]
MERISKPSWLAWGNAEGTAQKLFGHANVITTMIYTHVLNKQAKKR